MEFIDLNHYNDKLPFGFIWRWANFSPKEMASKGNKSVHISTRALDNLQWLRNAWGRPLRVNSAYRDPIYNARVGGAPRSMHKRGFAFDISVVGWTHEEKMKFKELAFEAGFTGFGGYNTFIHIDIGPARKWGQKWAWPTALGGKI